MSFSVALFDSKPGITAEHYVYKKAVRGQDGSEYEIRKPINPPKGLRFQAWLATKGCLWKSEFLEIDTARALQQKNHMFAGLDTNTPPVKVASALSLVIQKELGQDAKRLFALAPSTASKLRISHFDAQLGLLRARLTERAVQKEFNIASPDNPGNWTLD